MSNMPINPSSPLSSGSSPSSDAQQFLDNLKNPSKIERDFGVQVTQFFQSPVFSKMVDRINDPNLTKAHSAYISHPSGSTKGIINDLSKDLSNISDERFQKIVFSSIGDGLNDNANYKPSYPGDTNYPVNVQAMDAFISFLPSNLSDDSTNILTAYYTGNTESGWASNTPFSALAKQFDALANSIK